MATILLIDDDVDLVEMNQLVLTHRGHLVRSAYSAGQARQMLQQAGLPDLVVLDVMMESDTAGFELAREIHQLYPDVPTVILSGLHAATGVPLCFAPGSTRLPVVKFMDKPVAPAALADEIESILAK